MYLINAFSVNMLTEFPCEVAFTEISAEEARMALMLAAEADGECDFVKSAVGHADTAEVFGDVLGVEVACNRITLTLKPGEQAILGQYTGPRLPEGATKLPEGASIRWLLVEVAM